VVCDVYGWDRSRIDDLDYKEEIPLVITYSGETRFQCVNHDRVPMSRREVMQHIGSEGFRFCDSLTWVSVLHRELTSRAHRKVVIPDVRFLNEAAMISWFEGQIVRIVKVDGPGTAHGAHSSEKEMDLIQADHIIRAALGELMATERYPMFDATNLGAQVDNATLARLVKERRADAVLVSQVVTQRDVHKDNARQFLDELTRLGARKQVIAILGGPRLDHRTALELGYDAGFGPGTKPSDVANYLVGEVLRRMGKALH